MNVLFKIIFGLFAISIWGLSTFTYHNIGWDLLLNPESYDPFLGVIYVLISWFLVLAPPYIAVKSYGENKTKTE